MVDCNLERVRTNHLNKGIISDINQIPISCGGLIPTFSRFLNLDNIDLEIESNGKLRNKL